MTVASDLLNLQNAKGHASVVDAELSSMFRAHPLGEFEKRK
jgi:hypothetical protein